jgi:hypothetical protein
MLATLLVILLFTAICSNSAELLGFMLLAGAVVVLCVYTWLVPWFLAGFALFLFGVFINWVVRCYREAGYEQAQ